jgi:hypothetical protein
MSQQRRETFKNKLLYVGYVHFEIFVVPLPTHLGEKIMVPFLSDFSEKSFPKEDRFDIKEIKQIFCKYVRLLCRFQKCQRRSGAASLRWGSRYHCLNPCRVFTEVTFRNSSEYGVLCINNFTSS